MKTSQEQSIPLETIRITRREHWIAICIQGEYNIRQYRDGWKQLSEDEKISLMVSNALNMADKLCAETGGRPDEVLSFPAVTNVTKIVIKE